MQVVPNQSRLECRAEEAVTGTAVKKRGSVNHFSHSLPPSPITGHGRSRRQSINYNTFNKSQMLRSEAGDIRTRFCIIL